MDNKPSKPSIKRIKRKAENHPLLASAAIAAIGSAIWKSATRKSF